MPHNGNADNQRRAAAQTRLVGQEETVLIIGDARNPRGRHQFTGQTPGATSVEAVDLGDPANTPDVIRTTDMYKNFYSAQGVTIPGSPLQSRLFEKPLLLNVLHGGGQIFASQSDPHAQLINYWISHPAPSGQDEFSTATYNMFTPAYDPTSSDPTRNDLSKVACNTQ